jgi:hypothetical protein
VLIGKYRIDNIVEANFTWVSRGSKEQFHVVSVARSFNGGWLMGTALGGVSGVLSSTRRHPNHPNKRKASFISMSQRGSQRPRVVA